MQITINCLHLKQCIEFSHISAYSIIVFTFVAKNVLVKNERSFKNKKMFNM